MRNQEHAGNSYRVPTIEDFMNDTEPSGLPWGSISFGHVVTKGRESEGRKSSGHGTYIGEETYASGTLALPYTQPFPAAPNYSTSTAEEVYMEDAAGFGYSPVITTAFNPLPPP